MRFMTVMQCHFLKKVESFSVPHGSVRHFKRRTNGQKMTVFRAKSETENLHKRQLWKQFGFAATFSGATLVGATIWEYERLRAKAYELINSYRQPQSLRTGWRREVEIWWRGLTDGQRLFAPICFLNVLVFLAWQRPAFQSIMYRYFCTGSATESYFSAWSLVLNIFSHHSFWHLAANMYALHSFCTTSVEVLGKEQFMAMYLIGGTVASFAGVLFRAARGTPGPALGASGAILAVVSFACMEYPDSKLGIIFLPGVTFSASMALTAMMSLDLAGCILGWKFLDHAAHLGGALFGIFWHQWGSVNIWQKRAPILRFWQNIREPEKSDR